MWPAHPDAMTASIHARHARLRSGWPRRRRMAVADSAWSAGQPGDPPPAHLDRRELVGAARG